MHLVCQFEQAAAQMPRVRFAKVETDANPKASVANRIRSIPTLVLYRGANDLLRWLREQLVLVH
jgi:thioredoxin 2